MQGYCALDAVVLACALCKARIASTNKACVAQMVGIGTSNPEISAEDARMRPRGSLRAAWMQPIVECRMRAAWMQPIVECRLGSSCPLFEAVDGTWMEVVVPEGVLLNRQHSERTQTLRR